MINNLPIEFHLPGYQYCGPGTRLQERLQRGDKGVNPLEEACKQHDIAYEKNPENLQERWKADQELMKRSKERLKSLGAKKSERLAAYLVGKIMKMKVKFGMGLKKNRKRKQK